ncbi:MAG: hypothetical protein ABI746_06685 [Dermatophilaceae bacterium]
MSTTTRSGAGMGRYAMIRDVGVEIAREHPSHAGEGCGSHDPRTVAAVELADVMIRRRRPATPQPARV